MYSDGLTERTTPLLELLFKTEYTMSWLKRWDAIPWLIFVILVMWIGKVLYLLPYQFANMCCKKEGDDEDLSFSLSTMIVGDDEEAQAADDLSRTASSKNPHGSNSAISVSFAGYLTAVGIMLGGVYNGISFQDSNGMNLSSQGVLELLGEKALRTLCGLFMLFMVQIINDQVVCWGVPNLHQLKAGNIVSGDDHTISV